MPDRPPIVRVFLGLSAPPLASAAAWLIEAEIADGGGGGREVDLSGTAIVTPGGRAGRVLLALLVDACERGGRSLTPPRITTPGEWASAARPSAGRAASVVEQQLAWALALRASRGVLGDLIPEPPEDATLPPWLGLAAMLEGWHRELAGEGLRMRDVAPRAAAALPDWPDAARWRVLADVQARYEETLARAGLVDPDLARLAGREGHGPGALRAMPGAGETGTQRVVLVGVAELRSVARAAFGELAAARPGTLTALIAADHSDAEHFDELGCLRAEHWATRAIAIDDDRVRFVGGPRDQAGAAMAAFAELSPHFDTGALVFGLADAALAPHLEQAALALAGRPLHLAGGRAIAGSEPLVLLERLTALLERPTFANLAELARLPAIEEHLQTLVPGSAPAWWLDGLDRYVADRLVANVAGRPDPGETERAAVEFVVDHLGALLGPFHPLDADDPRTLAGWAGEALALLDRVLGARRVHRRSAEGRVLLDACHAVAEAAHALIEAHAALDAGAVPAGEALRALLAMIDEGTSPVEPEPGALEALGWLELALDPAPAAIVLGMNDGAVPQRPPGDGLLTESLRGVLGLDTSERRLARDRYALHLIARPGRAVIFIAGRHDAAGEPLWPSRLLLDAAGPRGGAAQSERLLRFLNKRPEPARPTLAPHAAPGADAFPVAPVTERVEITGLAPTAFKRFIASPYLFYLEFGLGLEERGAGPVELEPMTFGSLLHAALAGFGRSAQADSDDPGRIEAACLLALREQARTVLGPAPGLIARMQIDRAALRLHAFAVWQAQRRRSGWRIRAVEWSPESPVALNVDGTAFMLRGRIDRIEQHEDGRWAILDYKTSESRVSAASSHRRRDGTWIDLQLPLYRHLARGLTGTLEVDLGYVVLGADGDKVADDRAEWTLEDLQSAEAAANEVVRRIRRGEFHEVGEGASGTGSLALLCGTGLVGPAGAGEADAEAGGGAA